MAEITLKGNPIHTSGDLPAVGSQAPDFVLTKTDLSDVSLKDFAGKRVILNIFTSVDTSVCAQSVRKFNEEVQKLDNAVVLGVSADLPFAHARFTKEGGIEDLISVSDFRNKAFGEDYGIRLVDGPIAGLLSRAIVIIDENGKVMYTELVPEHSQEPDYVAALNALL